MPSASRYWPVQHVLLPLGLKQTLRLLRKEMTTLAARHTTPQTQMIAMGFTTTLRAELHSRIWKQQSLVPYVAALALYHGATTWLVTRGTCFRTSTT